MTGQTLCISTAFRYHTTWLSQAQLLSTRALWIWAIIWAWYISKKQIRINKAQLQLWKYQTMVNIIMIHQGNIQKAIMKNDVVEEKRLEWLIKESINRLEDIWNDLEKMKIK